MSKMILAIALILAPGVFAVNIQEAFFYSPAGYSHYGVKVLQNRFWTSSKVYSFMPTNVNPYIFDGADGSIAGSVKSDVTAAVICLPGLY